MSRASIESLSIEIAALMEEYAADVAEDMKAGAKEVTKEAVKELKQNSPVGDGSGTKGHYKDGWASKAVSESAQSISLSIYNKKKPGLTHLLEKGHGKRGGGRVEGIQHIEPAERNAAEEYERCLRRRLSQ